MGSKKPKWQVKQLRTKLNKLRAIARKANPGTKDLGVPHLGRHGGSKHGHGV